MRLKNFRFENFGIVYLYPDLKIEVNDIFQFINFEKHDKNLIAKILKEAGIIKNNELNINGFSYGQKIHY
ncbi:MAG: hypothetical protein K4H23_03295 [Mollicutes bacterium PWAP]|nr:hypothetical protein [Mollicutes bacterium PWAP]